ncbi:hypothetical protein G6F46_015581 [Rhizopus delemar]|nr:hypothetical protein G6F46_015581 [Rhizopus delemar]
METFLDGIRHRVDLRGGHAFFALARLADSLRGHGLVALGGRLRQRRGGQTQATGQETSRQGGGDAEVHQYSCTYRVLWRQA